MTLEELVSFVRLDYLDDTVTPYLWSDDQLLRYANEACLEACMRTPLITRTYTKAISIGNPDITIDPSIRRITTAKLGNDPNPLCQTSSNTLAMMVSPAWQEHEGNPRSYIRRTSKLTLYPKPIEADTLTLISYNVPDDDFDFEEDIDPIYQKDLAYWIVYKAYLFRDPDAYNPIKAKEFYMLFEQAFGIRHSAKYDNAVLNLPVNPRMTGGRLC